MSEPTLAPPPRLTVITGANGWLGRSLISAYTSGSNEVVGERPDVRALAPDQAGANQVKELSDRVDVRVGDITDPTTAQMLLEGAEAAHVIHTAGVIHPKKVADFYAVNVDGTKHLLRAASERGIRRFIHVSSNSPFGVNPTNDDTFRASEPYHPYMNYGRSKMQAEMAVKDADVEAVILRPPWFYGPFQPLRQTSFFKLLAKGAFPIVGKGDNRRSMAYVDNIVQGIARAERVEAAVGNGYWIADAEPYSFTQIVSTVQDALEAEGVSVKKKARHLPGIMGDVAERADAVLQNRGLYNEKVHVLGEMNKTIACDIKKSRDDLGYAPEVALFEGMRRSIRWCLDAGVKL